MLAGLSGRRDGVRAEAEQRARGEGLSPEDVRAAGDAAVREFDLRYGSLLVRGLPAGLPTLHNPGFVKTVLFEEGGTPRPEWRFVVPAPDAVAILIRPRGGLDQAGTERLVEEARSTVEDAGLGTERVTVSGTPALAAELGEQVRQEILLLGGLAAGLIGMCYFLVPWLGRKRYRLVPLTATLCATALVLAGFGWLNRPLSLGVVAFLPILVGIGSDFPAYLIQGAHRRRLLVAALASAAGFASLAVSPLPFVRDLGLALGSGVLLAVAVALLLRRYLVPDPEAPARASTQPATLSAGKRATLLALAGVVALGGWVALPRLAVQAHPDELAAGLPAVTDARHVEQVLGSSGEVQVVLRGPNVLTPEALAWMRKAQESAVVGYGSELRPIVSLPDLLRFLGPSPTPAQITAGMQLLPSYLTGAVVRSDARHAVVSLGIELQDLAEQQRLLDGFRASLPSPPPGYTADVVGLPVAAARGYELVSDNRYVTNVLGIALAGLVLFVGLRRRIESLGAVLAAALATGWGLAAGWALGIALTPLTVALGSLTTVTACEFTILLADRRNADPVRLRRTVAVAATTAAIGYLALVVSDLSVIREFGVLLAGTVALSFVAAHLVVRVLPLQRGDQLQEEPASTTTNTEVTV
ncbi:MAG: RND transporter [Pseudonocardiaceae bacterium]|nr:RND transporter [Pseudonocardiaceae bacterium]